MYVVESNNLIVNITFAWEEAWAITTEKDAEKLVSHRFPQYRFHHGQYPMFYQYRFRNGRMKYNLELASPGGAGRNRVLNKTEFMKIPVIIPTSYEEEKKIGDLFANLDNLITLHQREYFPFLFGSDSAKIVQKTISWEQRKLGDICPTFLDGDWIESKDQSDSGVRLIQTGNIGVGTYIEKEDRAKWVSEDTFNRLHCEEVFAGDILISRLPEPAGRACIVPETGLKMITAVDVTIARTSDEYDSNFILQFLCSDNYFKAVGNTLSGSTRQRISRSNLEQIPVPIAPTMQEQEQVGAFFSQLDTLITLHQREYFPFLFGSDSAKIVQKTISWEQRKLLGCIEKITDFRGRTPKKLGMDWSENGYLALSALNVKDGYIDFSRDVHYGNQELYDKWMSGNELHKGQVLFTTEAPMGNVAQVPDNSKYILSQRTIAFDVKADLITENFLAIVLRTPKVFSDLTALSTGGTAQGVSQKTLASLDIMIPRDLAEQDRLATFFKSIDAIITLHQHKPIKRTRRFERHAL